MKAENKRYMQYVTVGCLVLLAITSFIIFNRSDSQPSFTPSSSLQPEVKTQDVDVDINTGESARSGQPKLERGPFNESKAINKHTYYENPNLVYERFLPLARKGDAEAMYMLSAALERCPWAKKPQEGHIDSLRTKDIPEDAIAYFERQLKSCEPLYQTIGEQNLIELRDAWRQSAADAGNPFALLGNRIMSNATNTLELSDVPELLTKVFENSTDNEFLRSKAVFFLLNYRSEDAEFANENGGKPTRYALEYIHCELISNCTGPELQEAVISRGELSPNEYSEVIDIVSNLQASLQAKDWRAFGMNLLAASKQ